MTPQSFEIHVTRSVDGAELLMKSKEPDFDPVSPNLLKRIVSWFLLIFAVLFGVGGIWILWEMLIKLWGVLPLADPSMFFVLIPATLILILYIGGGGTFLIVLFLVGLYPRRLEIKVDRCQIREICRHGPFRWTRRIPSDSVVRVAIHAARQAGRHSFEKPLSEQPTSIRLDRGARGRWSVTGTYPHAIAVEAADHLSAFLSLYADRPVALGEDSASGRNVDAGPVDTMDPEFLNADEAPVPRDCDLRVQETPEGIRIGIDPPALTFKSMFSEPLFRAGIWMAIMPPVLMGLFNLLPATVSAMFWRAIVPIFILNVFPGILIMVLLVCASRMYSTYLVTPSTFEKTEHFLFHRWRKRWPRERIRAVRIAKKVGDKGRVFIYIQMVLADGRRINIRGGEVFALRSLAGALRKALGAPATCDDIDMLDPLNPLWHLQDEPQAPTLSEFEILCGPDELRIEKRPLGFGWVSIVASILMSGVAAVGIAGALFAIFGPFKPDERALMAVVSGLFLFLSLLSLVLIRNERTETFTLAFANQSVTRTHRSLFGTSVQTWDRSDVLGVGTRLNFSGNASPTYLFLSVRGQAQHILLRGEKHGIRHLCTVIRKETGLGFAESGVS